MSVEKPLFQPLVEVRLSDDAMMQCKPITEHCKPPKGVQGYCSWKIELYNSLTGSKQPLRAGKISTQHHKDIGIDCQMKPKMHSVSYQDCKNQMPSQPGCHCCFIIYRKVERQRKSDFLLRGNFIFVSLQHSGTKYIGDNMLRRFQNFSVFLDNIFVICFVILFFPGTNGSSESSGVILK